MQAFTPPLAGRKGDWGCVSGGKVTKLFTEKVMLRKETLGCQCGLLSLRRINSAPGPVVLFLISKLAARLGVEPRQNESESFVLPLHHRAVRAAHTARKFCTSPAADWSRRWDSNPQPPVYKTGALPLSYAGVARCAQNEIRELANNGNLVAPRGLEPRTN